MPPRTKESWEVRRASLHDRDELAALCRDAVGADDYVIGLLDDLILLGVLEIALDGDRIAGMMHYTPAIDGSAWLGAARTRPEYRRRGVASALIETLAGLAGRSGVHALRLWSAASNTAGLASVKASGFREVARFSRMRRNCSRGTSRATRLSFDPDLVEEVLDGDLARRGNGYVPFDRYFVPLTPANVHLLANAGALHRVAGGIVLLSAHPEGEPGEGLEIGLVGGDVAKILAAIPAIGDAMGAKEVHSFLPLDRSILDPARRAGFEEASWGREAVLFERPVRGGPSPYRKRRTYAEIAAGKREGYAAHALLAGGHGHSQDRPHEDRWNP